MKALFEGFEAVSAAQWTAQIERDLKGRPLHELHSFPERELEVKGYYHREETPSAAFPTPQTSEHRRNVRKVYPPSVSSAALRADLNRGVNCLGMHYADASSFAAATEGVLWEHVDADIAFRHLQDALSFKGSAHHRLCFDVLGQGMASGKWLYSTADYLQFFRAHPRRATLWVDGTIFGEAGASTVQELAYAANHLNEYIQLLVDHGIDLKAINQKIVVELSVTDNYFVNIAKFKVFRKLVRLIFSAYAPDFETAPFTLYARTSLRYWTQNEAYHNILRQTTAAMAAIIGGCDALTISSGVHDASQHYPLTADNIPWILKEEAHLEKVTDPAEGAHYITHLCLQLEQKSWALFQSVERLGGLCAAIERHHIQQAIEENKTALLRQAKSGEKPLLGVTKYPPPPDEWKAVRPAPQAETTTSFPPLTPFCVEAHLNPPSA